VRGLGLIRSLDDIRNIVLVAKRSTPITVANIGDVSIGYAPRLGIVGMNNRDDTNSKRSRLRNHSPTRLAAQHEQLLTENQDLRLASGAARERGMQNEQKPAKKRDHNAFL
jgi:Cu/Ag efflux pump CusA